MNFFAFERILRDFFKQKANKQVRPLDDHLQAAMDWMCLAQDVTSDGGVSLRYSLFKGWEVSYPETTGYIIPTFLNYYELTKKEEYLKRAIKMADWEVLIQRDDGSFEGGAVGSGFGSFVFDTGQVIFGLLAAHRVTGEKKYIESATKAGNWLVRVQNTNGMWDKFTFNSIPHSYYTMVAWALAELGVQTNYETYFKAASRNVDWALEKQRANGWFDCAGFNERAHANPYTHTIAYVMQGILETGAHLGSNAYIDAICRAADPLCRVIHKNGYCPGTLNSTWNSRAKFSCLTGNAQFAVIFLRLYEILGNEKYLEVAQSLNNFLCEHQKLGGRSLTRGAISGSYPIWGDYQRFAFPNWATKFFMDALLLERKIKKI